MKLRFIAVVSIFICFLLMLGSSLLNPALTRSTGAPAARCGSIADPLTCSNCHAGGPNSVQLGWITSDVPPSGYVSGMTYNISATATTVGRVKFGFEISPQSVTGAYLGTMIDTSAQTQIISTKYITHTSTGTSGTDSKTWAFNWTAPVVATDSVTFYGAFLCSNNNTLSSGDLTYKSSLTVHRDITASAEDKMIDGFEVTVYPNPASEHIRVKYLVHKKESVEIKLFDDQGQMTVPLMSEIKDPGVYSREFKFPSTLLSGVYILEISTESARTSKRILIQQYSFSGIGFF